MSHNEVNQDNEASVTIGRLCLLFSNVRVHSLSESLMLIRVKKGDLVLVGVLAVDLFAQFSREHIFPTNHVVGEMLINNLSQLQYPD